MRESPIFTRTHDLLRWLIPLTVKFPRSQRFVLAGRLHQRALDFQGDILRAAKSSDPLPVLSQADATLSEIRALMRLSKELELISIGQYEHGARMIAEIGRLLGGWLKTVSSSSGSPETFGLELGRDVNREEDK